MNNPPQQPHPAAAAMGWVSRIMTVALEMVLPGIAGQWLDKKMGTSVLGLAGFAFGLTFGIWHLLVMTKSIGGPRRPAQRQQHGNESRKDEREVD